LLKSFTKEQKISEEIWLKDLDEFFKMHYNKYFNLHARCSYTNSGK